MGEPPPLGSVESVGQSAQGSGHGAGCRVLVGLAGPFLGARFAFPDAGNLPEDTSARQAYDMVSEGFGPGVNGPLLLVADLTESGPDVVDQLAGAASEVPGVAAVLPPQLNEAGDAALITVIPETGPQHRRRGGTIMSGTVDDLEAAAPRTP